ncbi:MAG: hypothetical protein D6767_02610, partial [Candidatus Hydrogenedentota bacterium]
EQPAISPEEQTPAETEQEEEEDITLSTDELDGILQDTQEVPSEELSETPIPAEDEILSLKDEPATQAQTEETMSSEDFFSEEEEGPITLSPDEMDGILEDVDEEAIEEVGPTEENQPLETEPETESSEQPALSAEPASAPMASPEAPMSSEDFFSEEEEGPITLSPDEMSGILEDVEEEVEEVSPQDTSQELKADEEPTTLEQTTEETPEELPQELEVEDVELEEEPVEISSDEVSELVSTESEMEEETRSEISLEEDLEKQDVNISDTLPEAERAEDIKEEPVNLTAPAVKEEPVTISEEEGSVDLEKKASEEEALPDREELRDMIAYLDNLLGELPEETIKNFANSEYFKLYQKVLNQLGL